MVSLDVVQKRLRLLNGYLNKLYSIQSRITLEQFLADSDMQDIVERNLHLAIETVLDIGQHIIASSGWQPAEEYRNVFPILQQHDVITSDLLARVQGMAGFRNLLVHEYTAIDHGQVFHVLKNHLDDLVELARAYQNFVDAN
ncbi:MAG: DUF86 domain-containing protein [Chloroflexi bacterium]|nr:DUF86 domain-containing protein [Chloroflexota bacterium]